jgi:hypothetical protein
VHPASAYLGILLTYRLLVEHTQQPSVLVPTSLLCVVDLTSFRVHLHYSADIRLAPPLFSGSFRDLLRFSRSDPHEGNRAGRLEFGNHFDHWAQSAATCGGTLKFDRTFDMWTGTARLRQPQTPRCCHKSLAAFLARSLHYRLLCGPIPHIEGIRLTVPTAGGNSPRHRCQTSSSRAVHEGRTSGITTANLRAYCSWFGPM